MNEWRTFDDYFRYLEEQNYIDAQADLLAPEEIETLQEADAANVGTPTGASETPIGPISPISTITPITTPVEPDLGSEGDDPLLDD